MSKDKYDCEINTCLQLLHMVDFFENNQGTLKDYSNCLELIQAFLKQMTREKLSSVDCHIDFEMNMTKLDPEKIYLLNRHKMDIESIAPDDAVSYSTARIELNKFLKDVMRYEGETKLGVIL